MSVCYKPYVSTYKKCKKTTDIEKVTCAYCQTRLLREGKAKIILKEEAE